MRAALYYRVSTVAQSHALQREALRRVAEQRGFTTVEYVDTGSGSGIALPARDRMLAHARAGKLDVVVCWKFDRFGRSTKDLLDALENFRRWKVEFISVSEGVDTSTSMGKLVFTIFAALGEFERSLIGERVRAGIDAARARGTRLGRPRVELDVTRAQEMLAAGASRKATARALDVSPRTLGRALVAAAETSLRAGGRGDEESGTCEGPVEGGER